MYRWLTKESEEFLKKDYLLEGQSVDERVDIICKTAEDILKYPGFALKFKENIKKGWYSLSSPIWANFGTDRGLPISCFGSTIEDSMESILYTQAEVGMMTKLGGGTSAYFGNLRPRGSNIRNNGQSHGSVHFMQLFESIINIISQGKVRRGNFAAYLPIEHGDIEEFLTLRSEGSPIQDLSFGITITDEWLQSMIDGDKKKRKLWAKVLESRANTGYPYIIFIDNVNNNTPYVYRERGLKINSSNLCSEILLFSDEDNSFVCDLSSMNILHYDEWKDTDAVQLLTYFLDAVMTEFINKAEKIQFMERAVSFARNQRALGIGWLGWHSYLQSKMLSFESEEARRLNIEIAQTIQDKALEASVKMAFEYGIPPLLKGYSNLRNVTQTAIAPTKSSSFIMGQVSEGIEPEKSNYYVKDLAKGKFSVKNKYLMELLESKEQNNDEVWDSIMRNNGSVKHLKFLSKEEKEVFKTFAEIDPHIVIKQAADRQKYIDQSQSLNLMIPPTMSVKKINELYIEAWRLGIKSLYYQISVNAAQEFGKSLAEQEECVACSI